MAGPAAFYTAAHALLQLRPDVSGVGITDMVDLAVMSA